MNKTFLEYVAEDIISKYGTDLSRIAVVFPNKRAALFLNEHLARLAGQPVWSPAYITISDLFRQHTDLKTADPIKLICDIHKSFTKCTGIDETLDHFYGWGQLLLADFDDIDKNMADADSIFCNLKDIHELDDISYLDDEQKEMLARFFANFSDDIDSELKKRFLSLWSHFGDIYHDYNRRLTEQGIGYEGAIYRKVASEQTLHLKYDKYLFVGFNLLQKVERVLFSRLMKEGKAKFYWDFDEYYMPSPSHHLTTSPILHHIATLIKQVGIATKPEGDPLTQESVFRMYTILNRLATLADSGDLLVDNTTLRRLVSQLVSTSSIPFHGEPVVGVQIMGVLETRNIDFDHLLLLSCNEGNMPKGINDSSFIPYTIRKAHHLTTIDNKVAIYSYYFHRLLQRAGDITIAYNNSTDNGHTGEMSRFMLQLLVESGQKINHYSLTAKNHPTPLMPKPIQKDETVLSKLQQISQLSPSALNTYIRCPLAFYYQYIAHIQEPHPDPETIDNRQFGNIFHRAAYLIYKDITDRSPLVEKAHIQAYLSNRTLLANVVDRAFHEEECKTNNGLQIINREVIIEYVTKLLKIDQQLCPFSILAMEEEAKVYTSLSFTTPPSHHLTTSPSHHHLTIGGIIDRLDILTDKQTGKPRIRVVDYKTGNQPSSPIKNIDEIFDPNNIRSKHSNYFLQAILYSLIVSRSERWNHANHPVSPALLFIKQAPADHYDPTLHIDKHPISDVTVYEEEFLTKLKHTLAYIYSPDTPFTPTDDRKKCELCPYRMLCGL